MICIVNDLESTNTQREFVQCWNEFYFRSHDSSETIEETRVDWRVFSYSNNALVGHVAIASLVVEIDGVNNEIGTIGGLFTIPRMTGRGIASELMATAEQLVMDNPSLPTAIIFCQEHLLSFYHRRGWERLPGPVTLTTEADQKALWPHEAMVLPAPTAFPATRSLHIPQQ